MRTTLDLDIRLLEAAKSMAAAKKTNIGKIISEWALKGLEMEKSFKSPKRHGSLNPIKKEGLYVMPSSGNPITSEFVKSLTDGEGLPS